MKEFLDKEIDAIEQQMLSIIEENKELKRNYDIITSVKGVGMVTAIDLITNTRNFTKIKTAHEYASYAGTAPFEKSSGTMNRGAPTFAEGHFGDEMVKVGAVAYLQHAIFFWWMPSSL